MLKKPRQSHLAPLAFTLILSLFLPAMSLRVEGHGQQSSAAITTPATARERGIELYKHGDIKGAVSALRAAVKEHKDDADAWYYLSLALNRDNDFKGARKAIENTVKLRPNFTPARAGLAYFLLISNKSRDALREAERALQLDAQNAEAHYVVGALQLREGNPAKATDEAEAALKYNPNMPSAFLLKSQALLGLYSQRTGFIPKESTEARLQRTKGNVDLLKRAAESLEKFIQLNPSAPNTDVWREQLETLRVYAHVGGQGGSETEASPFMPSQVTTKARILSRPEPQYTEDARNAQVDGTVILRAVFAADGTIQNVLVLKSLPYGLTEAAVRAARKIKFVPALKDGRPVSQFIQIEYNFNLF